MPPPASFGIVLSVGGITINQQVVHQGDHPNPYEIPLAAAKTLTDWVKTDLNTAAGNLPAGHGYASGKFDCYWAGGKRTGVDGTVTVNALALDGGAGDDFPASGATVHVQPPAQINCHIDGDALLIIGVSLEYAEAGSTERGYLDLRAGAATIKAIDLAANCPQVWDIASGAANEFTGEPITVGWVSHSDPLHAATLKLLAMEDSTP